MQSAILVQLIMKSLADYSQLLHNQPTLTQMHHSVIPGPIVVLSVKLPAGMVAHYTTLNRDYETNVDIITHLILAIMLRILFKSSFHHVDCIHNTRKTLFICFYQRESSQPEKNSARVKPASRQLKLAAIVNCISLYNRVKQPNRQFIIYS